MAEDSTNTAAIVERISSLHPEEAQNHPFTPPIHVPTLADFELITLVRNLFYHAREQRRSLVGQWTRNYHVLNNRTWSSNRQSHLPSPEVPEIKPIISSLVGWMTDQRAQLDVTPSAEPFNPNVQFFTQLAEDLNTVLDSTWIQEDYDAAVETVLFDAFTYGTGFFKTLWDQQRHGGLGNAILARVDPFTIYPDPDARSLDTVNYIIEARTQSYQDIERRWPGALAKLGSGGFMEQVDESPTATNDTTHARRPMTNPGPIAPATVPRYGLPGQSRATTNGTSNDTVTVFEAWLRLPRNEDIHNPNTGKSEPTAIDAWRCVIITGDTILMDCWADEIFSHGQHPYDRYVLEETGEFWGRSMVELLTPAQISVNRLLGAIEHNIWLMGNPVLLEDNRAGLARSQITNAPGQRLRKNSNSEVKWMEPPQIHPQMSTDLIRFYIGEMERISGLSAIVRGSTPTGRNAEGVLDSVQEASFVRIRLALRNLERTLRSVGNKTASNICEFYDTPRVVALVGDSGTRSWKALRSNHFYQQTPAGRVPMKFQLNIEAGSSLPQSRQARIAEIDTLYAMGAVDEEAVLEIHRIHNWRTIVQRVRELKAANGTLGQPPGARQRTQRSS